MKTLPILTGLYCLLWLASGAHGQDPDAALQVQQQYQEEAQQSQQRIEELDDETMSLVASYNREIERHEDLLTYNENLRQLLASQERERARIQSELDEVEVVRQEIVPLIVEMVDVLDQFVELDDPMLEQERRTRVQSLRSIIGRADVDIAEKISPGHRGLPDRSRVWTDSGSLRSTDCGRGPGDHRGFFTRGARRIVFPGSESATGWYLGFSGRGLAAIAESVPGRPGIRHSCCPRPGATQSHRPAALDRGYAVMERLTTILLLTVSTMATVVYAQDPAESQALPTDQPQTIQQLIDSVREGTAQSRAELEEREQRFLEARDQQSTLLDEAIRMREEAEAEADRLRIAYEQGEDELAELEDLLTEQSGDMTEVFAVVTQVASDALPMVQNSMVSSQLDNRMPLLEKLTSNETIPSAEELRNLWLLLLDEMNYSGQVARYEAPVITAGGEQEMRQVTRIGTFTALSEGEYLRFLPESGRLLALARQPLGVDPRATEAFESAGESLSAVSIDPSRGAILSLIVQTPELRERLQQGGIIGYIILGLGAIGLLLGLERLIVVGWASRKARVALSGESTDGRHAINQLRKTSKDANYLADAEAMSAKMDEIVTTAAQKLRRGLPTLSIFAAVSPLLGLLGTVTGMIETFQVITLFGAGDPRLMSGGISQALITTQLGLSVAIPLLLIHSFVQGRANNLITNLDEIAADLFAKGRAEDVVHAG